VDGEEDGMFGFSVCGGGGGTGGRGRWGSLFRF
jgi:hypothetical protein